jgi:hypothetical protein
MRVRSVIFLPLVALIAAVTLPRMDASAAVSMREPQSSSSSSSKQKYSHANDFLIRGTVFTDKALAFPGVQLRIRRIGEKKFRWQDSTSSRGEFAIRVPQGAEYEMVVHAKGFADQSKSIDARNATSENNVVFRMEPNKKGKA